MSSDLALRVDGLGKAYTIRHQHHDHVTLAQVALDRAAHPFRRNDREELWALRDVSFELHQGEVLGVIGRNGAGKSTLLKLLTRITEPTTGRIDLWGRVGSLLEVGTGFHPELTGRENVYLNGSILGMSRKEIDRQFDAIVEFAGVERFLDTPVKRYSSGMYVRLAFAVAAHLETEVLLLDEVLAVGDADFQERCFRKVESLATSGRAVILVSHNIGAIRQFTARSLLFDGGALVSAGPTNEVVEHYVSADVGATRVDTRRLQRADRHWGAVCRIVTVTANEGEPVLGSNAPLHIDLEVETETAFEDLRVSVQITSLTTGPVSHAFSRPVVGLEPGTNTIRVTIPDPRLMAGRYTIGAAIGTGDLYGGLDNLDGLLDTAVFEVGQPVDADGRVGSWNPAWGAILYADIDVHREESAHVTRSAP